LLIERVWKVESWQALIAPATHDIWLATTDTSVGIAKDIEATIGAALTSCICRGEMVTDQCNRLIAFIGHIRRRLVQGCVTQQWLTHAGIDWNPFR
jgi:hypothetical protein